MRVSACFQVVSYTLEGAFVHSLASTIGNHKSQVIINAFNFTGDFDLNL